MEGRYTIILLASGENKELVSKFRKNLASKVKLPSVPPHVTLREDFFSKNIDQFTKEYKQNISDISPFEVEFTGIKVFQRGHVVYTVKNNRSLQKLHEITVETSQKYVSTPRIRKFECRLNKEQKELVEKYQLPFYFKYYNPHMTIVQLTDFKDEKDVLSIIHKKGLPNKVLIKEICVYDKLKQKSHKLIKL